MSSRSKRKRRFHRLGLSCLIGAAAMPATAADPPEQPQWLRLNLAQSSLDFEAEGERQTRTVQGTPGQATSDRLYLAPTVDLGFNGSFYHPNFLKFDLSGQGGYVWETVTTGANGITQTTTQNSFLQRYLFNMRLLDEKPYAASVFASKDHTFRDYDFFNRVTVDVERYGGTVGYSQGPVPITLSVAHLNEEDTGYAFPTTWSETTLFFRAYNERKGENHTELSYSLNDFTRTQDGALTDQGQTHFVTLNDYEHFGQRDWINLNSTLYYNEQDTLSSPEKNFTDNERLTLEHTPTLRSYYDYSFDRVTVPTVETDLNVGRAALRHQLFESLTSTFDVHGQLSQSSGPDTMLNTTMVGSGLEENYVKRLGSWGRLSLGNNAILDHTDQQSSGSAIIVVREAHTLTDGVVTFLNQPNVMISTIRITDTAGSTTYTELLDYLVVSHGDRTEIQRISGGMIPSGGAIAVGYQAASQPSASYYTANELMQIRLDLFDGLLGVYGRLNVIQNYGGESLVLQNLVDKVVGTDVSWKWLRAGAEYESFNSNLSPFRSERLFQSFTFEPAEASTLGFDLAQTWTTFPQDNTSQSSYSFISRYRARLLPHLSVDLEGGLRVQRGQGFDQDLATARAGLEYSIGKLSIKAGYEFQSDDFLGEKQEKNFFFFRGKRVF